MSSLSPPHDLFTLSSSISVLLIYGLSPHRTPAQTPTSAIAQMDVLPPFLLYPFPPLKGGLLGLCGPLFLVLLLPLVHSSVLINIVLLEDCPRTMHAPPQTEILSPPHSFQFSNDCGFCLYCTAAPLFISMQSIDPKNDPSELVSAFRLSFYP